MFVTLWDMRKDNLGEVDRLTMQQLTFEASRYWPADSQRSEYQQGMAVVRLTQHWRESIKLIPPMKHNCVSVGESIGVITRSNHSSLS
jgi:hypothetical protein